MRVIAEGRFAAGGDGTSGWVADVVVGWAVIRGNARPGLDGPTPTETTVVDLVRQGLTNPQIAHLLFLSPRTVQTHVSHVFQKTGLRSRVEIAAVGAPG